MRWLPLITPHPKCLIVLLDLLSAAASLAVAGPKLSICRPSSRRGCHASCRPKWSILRQLLSLSILSVMVLWAFAASIVPPSGLELLSLVAKYIDNQLMLMIPIEKLLVLMKMASAAQEGAARDMRIVMRWQGRQTTLQAHRVESLRPGQCSSYLPYQPSFVAHSASAVIFIGCRASKTKRCCWSCL